MKPMMRIVFCIGAAFLALAAPVAGGITYTFVPSQGDWDFEEYWTPDGGPPGPGDTAIIPGNRVCHIAIDDQEAADIDVRTGGILLITDGRTLTISDDSIVDGLLTFAKLVCTSCVGTEVGTLHLANSLKIQGEGGGIVATSCNCTTKDIPGRITGESGAVLTIDDGESGPLYLKNKIDVQVPIENSAHILLDNGTTMILGGAISGDGVFNVTSGTLRLDGDLHYDTGSLWMVCSSTARIVINAASCSEGEWFLGSATLEANDSLTVGPLFQLHSYCLDVGTAPSPLVVEVADGELVRFGSACD